MADANVILKIGSAMGPGGLASLQAGIQMVVGLGKAVADTVKELDQFVAIQKNVILDVSAADKVTKGLIDTTELYKNAIKLQEAQLNLTAKQYKDIAVLATDFAQKTGGDATEAMGKLTEAIIKGGGESLQNFGIKLKNTSDLASAQSEALTKLAERAEGVTIKIQNTTEAISAFGNNLGTLTGAIWKTIPASDSLTKSFNNLNDSFGEFNNLLLDSPDALGDYVFSLKGLKGVLQEVGLIIADNLLPAFHKYLGMFTDLIHLDEILGFQIFGKEAAARSLSFLHGKVSESQAAGGAAFAAAAELEKQRKQQGKEAGARDVTFGPSLEQLGQVGVFDPKKGRKGKGGAGGGAGGGPAIQGPSASEIEAEIAQSLDEEQLAASFESFVEEEDMALAGGGIGEFAGFEAQEQQYMVAMGFIDDPNLEERRQYSREYWAELEEQMEGWEGHREEELDFIATLRDETNNYLDDTSAGSLVAKGAMDLLHQSIGIGISSLIRGSASGAEAFRQMVVSIGESLAIEAAWRGVMELAHMLSSFASYDFVGGAGHAGSAAKYFAVAAIAGVAAHTAFNSSSASASQPAANNGQTGYTPSYERNPDRDRGGQQNVNVTITMDEDGLHAWTVNEDERAKRSGNPSLAA